MSRRIQNLSQEAFSKYGTILEFTQKMSDGWEIVVTSNAVGWRLALLEFNRQSASRFEYHPESKESFEPMSGTALLIVAENATPEHYEVFLLDQPICLNKGVWHEVIALSTKCMVKITENLNVECVYYELSEPLMPVMNQ